MSAKTIEASTVAEAFLRLLAARGVRQIFANAGTDFAPLIEAWVRCAQAGHATPRPVTVPHENVAMHMALGHWMVSGEPQALMVHVNVGTANAICGLLNAARVRAPILFMAGRTPINEAGVDGARNLHIHWTQEMFDQAGMVREAVKWDYELRNGAQLETVVDRALSIAQSAPTGPIYLTLPREVLAEAMGAFRYDDPSRRLAATTPHADPKAVAALAAHLERAQNPVIIAGAAGFEPGALQALGGFAERYGVPVVQHVPWCLNLPYDHPMHAGYDPAPWLAEADLVLVLECAVPWIPGQTRPREGATVVQAGVDPLGVRMPIRGFESDLAITGSVTGLLGALDAALAPAASRLAAAITRRREKVAAWGKATQERLARAVQEARGRTPIHPAWITQCIEDACGPDAILLREAPQFAIQHLRRRHPGTYFTAGAAGGLGWGLGAAIGAKLAAPDRLVAMVTGDGSYMFGAPVSAHYTALEQKTPFLTVIVDNQSWNAVAEATRHVYPQGVAATQGGAPLTYFDKSLRLEKTVDTVGGYGERVVDPEALPGALARALHAVQVEKRQAVLNVVCSG